MRCKILLGLFILVLLSNNSLVAQDSLQYQWERFSVSLGGFLTTMNSDISLMGQQSGLGINVNLEDALGLSTSTTVVRGEVDYNFGSRGRSHLRMGYFGLIRHSDKTLEAELEIGNSVFPIGTEISSKFDMHIIRALYDYAVFKDERISLDLSVGLYVLPVSFSISTGNLINESDSFIAPLPVVGIRNSFFITPKILLKQNIDVLYVKTTSFQGSITDLNVWLEYHPFKHWGVGLGYNAFRFNYSAYLSSKNKMEFEGTLKTGFTGLLFYGKYYF